MNTTKRTNQIATVAQAQANLDVLQRAAAAGMRITTAELNKAARLVRNAR